MRNFYIYRLTFNSYLAGFDDTITDDDKLSAASSLFECINENMSFLDGNSIPVEADPPTRFGKDIVYTRIAKESHTTINAKKSHKESKVNDYPYFSVAFDFRHPLDYILVAIEHKRKAFANIKTVADGLEEYFNRSIKDFEVKLRPASFSKVFWKRIEQKCRVNTTKMKSFQVEIPDIQSSFPLTASEEENSFLSTFFMMVKGTGGDDGFFGFGVDDDSKYLEVNRVKERWGKIVHLACKNGYIIKAIMHNGMEVSSSEVAPAIYPMDRKLVGDVDETSGMEQMPIEKQCGELKNWFDNVYDDLKKTEEDKHAGKSKRNIKK